MPKHPQEQSIEKTLTQSHGLQRLSRRGLFQQSMQGALALSAIGMLGCSKNGNSNNKIRMGISSNPQMLDPRKATDALSSRINRLIYRQLIDFDDTFLPKPDLANWQQLSTKHYRFSLIDQPSFHHSKKSLTSDDVIATYQSVLDKNLGSAHRGSLINIEKIQSVDEKTFDFFLKEADAQFVGRLVIGILPADLIQQGHEFHLKPVGSGAFEFVSQDAQKLMLRRIQDNQSLEFLTVKDATVRVLKLRNNELDLVQNDLSPELVEYSSQQSDLAVDWQKGTNFGYIGFNFEDPLLAMSELRQAIAHGINRHAIIEAIFKGHARLAKGLLVPEHWCGVKSMEDYDFNPEKTKALVSKVIEKCLTTPKLQDLVGYEMSPAGKKQAYIELSYKTSNDPTRIRLATIYQSQLRPFGIRLKIQSYDWGTFYNDIKKGRFQLYSLAWVGVKSPDIFQYVFASSAIPPKGANRGRFIDKETDELIYQASQALTLDEQAHLYQTLQKRLHYELAAMPLWYEDQYLVRSKKLTGYALFSDGRYDGLLHAQKVV